ncbi:bifunctional RecB family nuclease/DEAD/DEAH box helicase [Prescottella defluvii]|uniref:TM0106 family RecB-like putative nuclease n=1 Tax=Prescottella defluvii TaxID=1323361 RepID=UPI0004F325A6|nr:bifunctional RecB family nuclease/DEAD/DEAH box helicase [Prescottella defluvii]
MFLLDDVVVYSTGDLTLSATCEFALVRRLDGLLGRVAATPGPATDPMLERTSRLGAAHERRLRDDFEHRLGRIVTIARPEYTTVGLYDAHRATVAAARSGAPVIYQGTFFDGRFLGFSDFLVREVSPDGDTYAVYDTKLARHVEVPALLQLAAYAHALAAGGVRPAPQAHLLLGDGTDSVHALADLVPVYVARRARLQHVLDEHRSGSAPARWGDTAYRACGRCGTCTAEVRAHRDLLLVAGIRSSTREHLVSAGVSTIDALAARVDPVPDVSARTLDGLRSQAVLQLRGETHGGHPFEVFDATALAGLPHPDSGDIFFDFEGDPLWAEPGSPQWGLEYLFGVLEEPPTAAGEPAFRPFWAHDRSQERRALIDFLDYVTARRAAHPGMHIYHYAAYEKSALLRLCGRHGVGEEAVDALLRDGVLVDLYPIVRASLRVGEQSYSIKKLEPLYMGADPRGGAVTSAADSVVAYADYCDLRDRGRSQQAAELLRDIGAYNEYDCVSTRGLRNWLLALAAEHGVSLHRREEPAPVADESESDPAERALRRFTGDGPRGSRSADQQASALMAAAVGYHRRERKPFWWAHFDRLTQPVDEWADTRDVLQVHDAVVVQDWHRSTPRQRKLRRHLRLTGRYGTGSTVVPGAEVFTLYDPPLPVAAMAGAGPTRRGTSTAVVLSVDTDGNFDDVVVVEELLTGPDEYTALPMAVTPGHPVATVRIENAIGGAAENMAATLPAMPSDAAVDILRRIPPRTRNGAGLPATDGAGGHSAAIVAALLDLDHSYLAVQGPPGTGKTHTGARVIAHLASHHRWRIGVVAQSHSVVENMLDAVVAAGLDGRLVAKKDGRAADRAWTGITAAAYPQFLADAEGTGGVVGGTAWDFAHADRIPPGSLDLLVIDEAGQFALANTVAVAASARNLLLLGDPQQLPQVSQGTHPEPVDESALGWLAAGHDALPAQRGYFLERTWRMHPALCARVSALSYDGRLQSEDPVTTARHLAGVEPGMQSVVLDHCGNATTSAEEAGEIVRRIQALLGRAWTDPTAFDGTRPLGQSDVLVVAPYNAQVGLIRRHLTAAGLADVHVGTVDKFQGRQAAVVLVSMTASTAADVPRGMSFLLSRNRLNVAVSRGKWCAVIVRSRLLTHYLPTTPDGLTELGAFTRLCE